MQKYIYNFRHKCYTKIKGRIVSVIAITKGTVEKNQNKGGNVL